MAASHRRHSLSSSTVTRRHLYHSIAVIVLVLATTSTTIAMATGSETSQDSGAKSGEPALTTSQSSSGSTGRQDTQTSPALLDASLGSSLTKDDELIGGGDEDEPSAAAEQKQDRAQQQHSSADRKEPSAVGVKSEVLPAPPSVESGPRQAPSGSRGEEQQQKLASEVMARASESLPAMMSSGSEVAKSVPLPVVVSPKFFSSLGELAAKLPDPLTASYEQLASASMGAATSNETTRDNGDISGLLPKGTSLFNRDSLDAEQLGLMDCHLRNVDYCLAGLLGSSQKLLPETSSELETRCDEMQVTSSCLAVYNKRCQTFKIFSMLMPLAQAAGARDRLGSSSSPSSEAIGRLAEQQRALVSSLASEVKLAPEIESALFANGARPPGHGAGQVSVANLTEFCEPSARKSAANAELRQRVFSLAKCINGRVPKLAPCLDDFKTALQVFYEPKRVLPMQPTCCAVARFRACATSALDQVCGLSSFETLVGSMGGSRGTPSSPLGMLNSMDRLCRQATDHKSPYCAEVLPPSGMRAPQRRGPKASKLARALDLISFSPPMQASDVSLF